MTDTITGIVSDAKTTKGGDLVISIPEKDFRQLGEVITIILPTIDYMRLLYAIKSS